VVTVDDIRAREPELKRLKPDDSELERFIINAENDSSLHYELETGETFVDPSPHFDLCVEFLALQYIFESLIRTDDVYLVKADRYKKLYQDKFNSLSGNCDIVGVLR